jgi:succinate dehydrogenase hydrophobic anchor subunit
VFEKLDIFFTWVFEICGAIIYMWESQVNNNRYGSGEILSRSNEPCIVAWTLLILATFIIHLWVGI